MLRESLRGVIERQRRKTSVFRSHGSHARLLLRVASIAALHVPYFNILFFVQYSRKVPLSSIHAGAVAGVAGAVHINTDPALFV